MPIGKGRAIIAGAAMLVCLMMTVSPATVNAEVINGIAAIVNDNIITIYELDREYSRAAADAEKREGKLSVEAAGKLRRDVLDTMIDRKLVGERIRELRISVSEEEVRQSIEEVKKQNRFSQDALVSALAAQGMTFDQYKNQMKEQLERLRLMSQEVKSKIQVGEREILKYYEDNPAQFSEEPTYRARHIFLSVPKNASSDVIKKIMVKAADVIAEAKTNADFAGMAKKYSDDPGAAENGGDLGTFKKGDMLPEIESAVITMQPGEVSEIVTTKSGFHIIKLEEKNPGKVKPFESVKAAIEETLYRNKSEARFRQWAEELRKGAVVEVK